MAKRGALRAALGVLGWCAAGGAAVAACAAASHDGVSSGAGGTTTTRGTGGAGGGTGGAGGSTGTAGEDGGFPLEGGAYCGNQVHQVQRDAPNLYFVFDVSGSMADPAGGGLTKYQIVEHSAVIMIETLGPLINVGAAVFPAPGGDSCAPGVQVFPVSPGDPVSPMTGPTTGGFIAATSVNPSGGTPTAATLAALQPGLLKIPGRTVVILATDGGPNCDAALTCAKDQCVTNIEGACNNPLNNCCAAGGASGPQGCLDHDAAVASVAALAAAKIPVVVVGIPGSDLFASVLDDMAVAGGAAQAGPPSYYQVDDLTMLTQTFQSIAQGFISCDFVLTNPPPDQDHTNVYFDGAVVLEDPVGGWVWKGPGEIELVGAACAELKSGTVKEVRILSGCPSQKST